MCCRGIGIGFLFRADCIHGVRSLSCKCIKVLDKRPKSASPRRPYETHGIETGGVLKLIYFIQGEVTRAIKIGKAVDVAARLQGLQTGSAETLELLGTVPGGRAEEVTLHRTFERFHLRGEWFKGDPDFVRMVKRLVISGGRPVALDAACRNRGGCRNGLPGQVVAIRGVDEPYVVAFIQWGEPNPDLTPRLLVTAYPEDGPAPVKVWRGPDTEDNRRCLELGVVPAAWYVNGWLRTEFPLGTLFNHRASECVLLSNWDDPCCPLETGR